MTIREATIADIPELVALGLRFRATTGYAAILTENPDQMRATAERLIMQDDAVIFVSEDRGGLVAGMIGVQLYVDQLDGALTAGEHMWYVMPDARGDGIRLLKTAEQWARTRGAAAINMIQPTGTDVDVLYRRLGYGAIETVWHKRLVPVEAVA